MPINTKTLQRSCSACPDADRCPLARFTAHAPVRVFERTWDRVDEARQHATAAGVDHCIHIHHADALELLAHAV